ncbi:DUF1772 domain-containing protein [Actinosynnema sp. NPDC047251]|nr:DUF1772 domain-containing protein [Saccharothrix espanaensis]
MSTGTARRIAARALGLAEFGHAHWFFGNLYEAVVRVPDRLADREGGASPVGVGSPVRYYLVGAPLTLPAALAAAVAGWGDRGGRPWLVAAVVCSGVGVGLTAHLVRTVNLDLFFRDRVPSADERKALLRAWYRVNAARLVATGGALVAARVARSRLSR